MKLALLIAAFFFAASATSAQDLNAEMTALGNAWKTAYERADASALAALYAEQVDFVNAQDGSVTTRTRAEVEARWKKTFETRRGTIEFEGNATAALLPNGKANTQGRFTQTITDSETGETTVFKGRYDHQAVRENGQWKLCLMKVIPE